MKALDFALSGNTFRLHPLTGYMPQEEKSHLNREAIALVDW